MSTPATWQAVYARYLADTGTGGLHHASAPIITAMYLEVAPETAVYPYVVFTVQDDTQSNTLGKSRTEVFVSFNVYTSKDSNLVAMVGIMNRLRTVYDRWIPSGVTGYEFETFQRRGGRMIPSDIDAWHFADEYVVGVSAA